ncbi:uncharacterized protein VTP21DRAFT_7629 [Calcarisporiella thermophila]|uniref:uncharacterized protein n=1 Tax=Calcarisporiella thermophila TaxID=911321 RepID=UPI00374282FF
MDPHTINEISKTLTKRFIDIYHPNNTSISSSTASDVDVKELARILDTLLTNSPPINTPRHREAFLNQLRDRSKRVLKYEDRELLDEVIGYIPLDELYTEAERDDSLSLEDAVVKRLVLWFHGFFKWVNCPQCDCGGSTRSLGNTEPTDEELRYEAYNVELYECTSCGQVNRFPRYEDPRKLLDPSHRRGRCGEWANCFTLCCRAMGYDARYILDTTDHVWTEVWSENLGRWVHCDPCEPAFDKPLLYTLGWKKKIAYCIALSADEVVDVTRRYTCDFEEEVLPRRYLMPEVELKETLERLSLSLQQNLDDVRREQVRQRSVKEEEELISFAANQRTTTLEEMQGRKSGSLNWRVSRGEVGEESGEIQIGNVLFESSDELISVGDTQVFPQTSTTPPTIRLTDAIPGQLSAVYFRRKIDLSRGFVCDFTLRITDRHGNPAQGGAEGLAMVIQSQREDAIGEGGCGMGYAGIAKSLAVEFDTYENLDRCDDPSSNHISIHGRLPPHANSAHHSFSLACTSRLPPLTQCPYAVRIAYLPWSQTIIVCLTDIHDDQAQRFVEVLRARVEIEKYCGGTDAWIGFTSSCGALSQRHEILNWKLWETKRVEKMN